MKLGISSLSILLCLANSVFSLRPSPGCNLKNTAKAHKHETVNLVYEDKLLGPVDRNYIIQYPNGMYGIFF